MLEAKSPASYVGWRAVDDIDVGVVTEDRYVSSFQNYVLTVEWNDNPPEVILIDREEPMRMMMGYQLVHTAGRNVGLIPQPIIHRCASATETCLPASALLSTSGPRE